MTIMNSNVNTPAPASLANIRNVQLCYEAVNLTQRRMGSLPGLSVFYGPSGFGKSMAAVQTAVRLRGFYLQVASTWNRKNFLEKLLHEMGIAPGRTVADMVDQVAEELHKSGRPLIVDEFDHMVTAGKVELIRDIYEISRGTILLIGEEQLPKKLEKWERFHGRVLHWMPALPVDLADVRLMEPVYSPLTRSSDDLLDDMLRAVRGSTRRAGGNLHHIEQTCLQAGISSCDLATWRSLGGEWITGDSPKPRSY